MDKHLYHSLILPTFGSTVCRGMQIDAEKSPFLTDRLKIWMLPTLALIRNEKTEDYVVGFNELGGKDDFPTTALEGRLHAAGLLFANQQVTC